ncbi:MAG: ROK family protein, partial [Opitutales bacterium]|nr:ROK family protein [Opitutales bacterium]
MKKLLLGIDIGGTKCAVCLGKSGGYGLRIAAKKRFETPVGNPRKAVEKLLSLSAEILEENAAPPESLSAIGVSCGGPLDSKRGVILSPPNLPGWDGIEISAAFESRFGAPCGLQNDANACALAEWKFGAGRGLESMVFLTFGT